MKGNAINATNGFRSKALRTLRARSKNCTGKISIENASRLGSTAHCRWKHAIACHQGSTFVDLEDVFEKDTVYDRLKCYDS